MPRGIRRTEPILAVCARVECGRAFPVSRPFLVRKRKYCSHHCAGLVCQNILPAALAGKGARISARRRQQRVLARVAGLTPLEAFRRGYTIGLQSKLRQIRKRYELVPRSGR